MPAADRNRPTAAVVGCAGTALGVDERQLFGAFRPLGFILFARNVETPDQVRALIADLRRSVGRDDAPVLIDQEGGRVARLKPPHWPAYPPGKRFAELFAVDEARGREAARLGARLIAHDLHALGIDVDCAPVLDVPAPGGHEIIGDRAYGDTSETVAALGRAVCDGLLAGGVLPVIKHVPGHGRAGADSHLELPRVDATLDELGRVDFAPFKALADAPCAMTAHVLYDAIDRDAPATTSPKAIRDVVRGEIGFDGLLFSDDVSMQALSGSIGGRTAAAMAAGCDIALHCNGDIEEARAVLENAGPMTDAAAARWARAAAMRRAPEPLDTDAARTRFDSLLTGSDA